MISTEPVLPAGVALDAGGLVLEMEPVPADAVAGGRPATGVHGLGSFSGLELGVWEMSEGGMYDTEADEVFLVLSGEATVQFLAADGSVTSTAALGAHSLMRLAAGARTRWTVHRTLRKVYLSVPA